VLVSRRASVPLTGSVVVNQSDRFASGLSPLPDGLKLLVYDFLIVAIAFLGLCLKKQKSYERFGCAA